MKLTLAQLESQLTKKLSLIYVVSGDELLLKQDAIQLIRDRAKQQGFTERTRLVPEAGYDWNHLYTLLYATSLLAEKRLIELDFRDMLPNKTASTILQAYADNPIADNVLLVDIGKIDDKIAKSAWYQALEKQGLVAAIWPIPIEQLPAWIMQRAKRYQLSLQPAAAQLLADYVEGNLVAAAQAIEKMVLLKPERPIDVTLVADLLSNESRHTVFDLVETLLTGNKTRTLRILDNLREEGIEAILIIWAIARELRTLAEMAYQLKQGQSHDALFKKYRVFARRQAGTKRFLGKFAIEDLWRFLVKANEIDGMIKGVLPGNPWNQLELLCLQML